MNKDEYILHADNKTVSEKVQAGMLRNVAKQIEYRRLPALMGIGVEWLFD